MRIVWATNRSMNLLIVIAALIKCVRLSRRSCDIELFPDKQGNFCDLVGKLMHLLFQVLRTTST